MLTDPERYFYDRGQYGEIAAKVDRAMRIDAETQCTPGAECDLDYRCEAHFAALEAEPDSAPHWSADGGAFAVSWNGGWQNGLRYSTACALYEILRRAGHNASLASRTELLRRDWRPVRRYVAEGYPGVSA